MPILPEIREFAYSTRAPDRKQAADGIVGVPVGGAFAFRATAILISNEPSVVWIGKVRLT